MWGEHVCMFDRTRREREGQSHGGTARSRPRLSSPDCLDWLKKTNPSGQAVGWRQALLGPPPLLLLNIKLFQMIYGRSPLGDLVLFTFCSPENWLMGVESGSLLRAEDQRSQHDNLTCKTCSISCVRVPFFAQDAMCLDSAGMLTSCFWWGGVSTQTAFMKQTTLFQTSCGLTAFTCTSLFMTTHSGLFLLTT